MLALSVGLVVLRVVEGDPPLQILFSALVVAVWIFNLYALRKRLRGHEGRLGRPPGGLSAADLRVRSPARTLGGAADRRR